MVVQKHRLTGAVNGKCTFGHNERGTEDQPAPRVPHRNFSLSSTPDRRPAPPLSPAPIKPSKRSRPRHDPPTVETLDDAGTCPAQEVLAPHSPPAFPRPMEPYIRHRPRNFGCRVARVRSRASAAARPQPRVRSCASAAARQRPLFFFLSAATLAPFLAPKASAWHHE